jgi:hypothetical protein
MSPAPEELSQEPPITARAVLPRAPNSELDQF